ncbi:MAG: lipoyl(octanoyl) transferase [Actinomycetota bacterium]|nr:lipoyl(octanoyl) transferase [Actinomycetota bacterium]
MSTNSSVAPGPSRSAVHACADGDLRFEFPGFGPDRVEYLDAWERQRAVHAAVVGGSAPDTVILLEHPPVYTAGRRTAHYDRPVDGTPVVEVDRGGRITWHGPGQLVGYPIVRLAQPVDVVAYVRRLEEAVIRACADLGLATVRVPGRSGVWVAADDRGRERKVAAVGVRVARGTTMHGFALNCDPDLSWFNRIVPCGIPDADVTSLTAELDRPVTVEELVPIMCRHLHQVDLPGHGGPGAFAAGA